MVNRTLVPIFMLIGLGYITRMRGVLREGDERVLSAYVYWLALPALFLVDMSEIEFTAETLGFAATSLAPVVVVLLSYMALKKAMGLPDGVYYLLVVCSLFGSLGFFGIPFVTFAFPTQEGERLASLSVASISIVSVSASITALELSHIESANLTSALRDVSQRLALNPLIISIFAGLLISLAPWGIPEPISLSLHLLGGSSSPVAIFMLGVFLYGRRYVNLGEAFRFSLLRMILMPSLSIVASLLIGLPKLEATVLALMHGTPLAISMIVLSERYDFYRNTISSLILISSLSAGIYLNLWLSIIDFLYPVVLS